MQTPELRAPSKSNFINEKESVNKHSSIIVYLLLSIVVCLLLIIFFLILDSKLSQTNGNLSEEKISVSQEINNTPNVVSIEEKNNEHIEFDWMLKKSEAEDHKIPVWANEQYIEALELGSQAEAYKDNAQYSKSEEKFNQAIQLIEVVFEKKEEILKQLIKQGFINLEEENLDQAKKNFDKALAINEKNKLANRGLQRISQRQKVVTLYEKSLELEKKSDINSAIIVLKQAIEIEPEYKIINKKLQELLIRKKLNIFDIAINNTLAALDKNNFTLARKEIKIAQLQKPNDPTINELNLRIKNGIVSKNISILKHNAQQEENKEQWQEAIKSYKKILLIDPGISQIIVKQQRVKAYIKINQLLDDIINDPIRLQNDKIFEQAKTSLEYVKFELAQKNNHYYSEIKTPLLMKKIVSAEDVIMNAGKEINVTIQSDNKTNISIYRVSKLGKILSKQIKLRPGKYTVFGSRVGYKDFRKIVEINANDQSVIIHVQCKEKI